MPVLSGRREESFRKMFPHYNPTLNLALAVTDRISACFHYRMWVVSALDAGGLPQN